MNANRKQIKSIDIICLTLSIDGQIRSAHRQSQVRYNVIAEKKKKTEKYLAYRKLFAMWVHLLRRPHDEYRW